MRKESMLVVEDEDIMREALFDYFTGEGHRVDTAADGDNALKKINMEKYDIMIIDLRLPGRDGLSILKEVRAKNPKAKVIMITAYPSVETEEEAKRSGAVDYLTKPFEINYLDTLIRQSYEVEVVPEPVVEVPVVEEEIVTPCIWMQAGIVKKRMCTHRYRCHRGCDFHAAMMKKDEFRNDPRIKPFLDKLESLLGKNQCRYTMSGQIAFRSCARLFHCENCEFDEQIQFQIDRELARKDDRKKIGQTEKPGKVIKVKTTARRDH